MFECEKTSFSYFVDSEHSLAELTDLAHCYGPLSNTESLSLLLNPKNDS